MTCLQSGARPLHLRRHVDDGLLTGGADANDGVAVEIEDVHVDDADRPVLVGFPVVPQRLWIAGSGENGVVGVARSCSSRATLPECRNC